MSRRVFVYWPILLNRTLYLTTRDTRPAWYLYDHCALKILITSQGLRAMSIASQPFAAAPYPGIDPSLDSMSSPFAATSPPSSSPVDHSHAAIQVTPIHIDALAQDFQLEPSQRANLHVFFKVCCQYPYLALTQHTFHRLALQAVLVTAF